MDFFSYIVKFGLEGVTFSISDPAQCILGIPWNGLNTNWNPSIAACCVGAN